MPKRKTQPKYVATAVTPKATKKKSGRAKRDIVRRVPARAKRVAPPPSDADRALYRQGFKDALELVGTYAQLKEARSASAAPLRDLEGMTIAWYDRVCLVSDTNDALDLIESAVQGERFPGGFPDGVDRFLEKLPATLRDRALRYWR